MTDFLDCIRGHIPEKLYKRAEKSYNESYKKHRANDGDESARAKAAEETARFFDEEINAAANRRLKSAKRSLDLWDEITNRRGDKSLDAYYGEIILERIASSGEYNKGVVVRMLNEFLRELGPRVGVFNPRDQVRQMKNLVRESMGFDSGDLRARAFFEAYDKANTWLIDSLNKAGANITKRKKRQIGQNHDSELIKRVSYDDWWGFIKPKLNLREMIDKETGQAITGEKLELIAPSIYKKITTGVSDTQMASFEAGEIATFKRGGLEERFNNQRFFVFKDPESFFEYNEKFGSGNTNLYNTMLNEFTGMSELLAIMDELGPKPEDVHEYLMQRISVSEGRSKVWGTWRKNQLDGAFKILANQDVSIDKPSLGVEIYGGVRGLFTAAKLGSAALLAPADVVFSSVAAKANGFSGIKTFRRYFGGLNPASAENRTFAENLALAGDVINNRIVSAGRHVGDEYLGKSRFAAFGQKAGSFVIEASSLRFMTDNAKRATGIEFYGSLGSKIKHGVAWEKLDNDFKGAMSLAGIQERDWDNILKIPTAPLDPRGKTAFLLPENITDPDLGRKIGSLGYRMMRLASNEPSIMLRSVKTGFGASRSSATRLAASDLMYLKTFAFSVLFNHMIPAFSRAYSGVKKGDISKLDNLAMLVAGGTLLGTATSQLREVANGRDMRDFEDPKTYANGMLNSGGLSIFGDFLFSDYARSGASFAELISPWAAQNVGKTIDVFKGDIGKTLDPDRESNIARSAYRTFKDFIPAQNLWYSRLLTDRLIFDNFERLLDPKFNSNVRRRESIVRNQSGQEYWWGRGDTLPERAPEIAEAR